MEEMMKMLKEIQKDMQGQKQEICKIQDNLQKINENINEKFESIDLKTKALEDKLEKQQRYLDSLEQQMKKRNIIFFGVEENERYYGELEENILKIINNTMKISCEKRDIELVRRLGKKNGSVRPVVLTLATMGLKIQILRNKIFLKDTCIYMKEDFTLKILQKRKELQGEFLSRREKGENVIIKYDKIVSLNSKSKQQGSPKKRNNKRKPYSSPETLPPNQHILNNYKKNKSIESYMTSKNIQSSSTSLSSQT